MEFFIDRLNRDFVEGWAIASGGIRHIEVFVDEERIGVTHPWLSRPDVRAAKPNFPAEVATRSGFLFAFSPDHFRRTNSKVWLRIVPLAEAAVETPAVPIANIGQAAFAEGQTQSEGLKIPAPFPGGVMAALCALRGATHYDRPWTNELIEDAIQDIQFLLRRGSQFLPGIYPYLGYLKGLWARFLLIRKHFPKFAKHSTEVVSRLAKDAIATGTCIEEIITISHHLFVLHDRGIQGHFAEFGCFKGFSTALLSNACFELGIQMDVFDSFAGLPPSESTYYNAGEFMGSLDEVKRNVAEYGRSENVRFHPGFFSDTVPRIELPLMCIWMDVDLASSSRDVMRLFDRLPTRSCLFSHECTENHFDQDTIKPGSGSDDVIPPIIEAFQRAGRNITGRHLCGYTGAFWNKDVSWPVLPTDAVLQLIHLD